MATLEKPRSNVVLAIDDQVPAYPDFSEHVLASCSSNQIFQPGEEEHPPQAAATLSTKGKSVETVGEIDAVSSDAIVSLRSARSAFLTALNSFLGSFLSSTSLLSTWEPLAPLRRHSVPSLARLNPYGSVQGGGVSIILNNLKTLSGYNEELDVPMKFTGVPLSVSHKGPIDELQYRVDKVAKQMLSKEQGDMVRSLAALVGCIDRLLVLSAPEKTDSEYLDVSTGPSNVPLQPSSSDSEVDGTNIYETLRRQASEFQVLHLPVGRNNEIEGNLEIAQVEGAEKELLWGRIDDLLTQVGELCHREERERKGIERPDSIFSFNSLLSHDLPEYGDSHLPPEYVEDFNYTDEKAHVKDSNTPVNRPSTSNKAIAHRISLSNIPDEKMQRDIESVSMAIERLYLTSPQLLNQRVDPPTAADRIRIREAQLSRLQGAIERLSKGRMEDQRAVLPEGFKTNFKVRLPKDRSKEEGFDDMVEKIGRASSRRLNEQRSILRPRHKDVIDAARRTAKEASSSFHQNMSDPVALQSLEVIMAKSGRGRMSRQDATFSTPIPSTPLMPIEPALNEEMSMAEFLKSDQENRPRSNSLPQKQLKNKWSFSWLRGAVGDTSTNGIAPSASNGSLKGKERQWISTNRPTSYHFGNGLNGSVINEYKEGVKLEYFIEQQTNTGTLSILVWPQRPSVPRLELEIESLGSNLVTLGSKSSLVTFTIDLPCEVVTEQIIKLTPKEDHFELNLTVVKDLGSTSSDFGVAWSADELQDLKPTSFVCTSCHNKLVDSGLINRYRALPSEHWLELVEAWVCHHEQTFSDEILAASKNLRPNQQEAFVGTSYLLFNWDDVVGANRMDGKPPILLAEDILHPAQCKQCDYPVGYLVTPKENNSAVYFRLSKLMSNPIHSTRVLPSYSLSQQISCLMIESSHNQSIHRFLIQDEESSTTRLMLWLFNPHLRTTLSSSSWGSAVAQTFNSCKIFFKVVDNDSTSKLFYGSDNAESIQLPLKIILQLKGCLVKSNAALPLSRRSFGGFLVGFLERL